MAHSRSPCPSHTTPGSISRFAAEILIEERRDAVHLLGCHAHAVFIEPARAIICIGIIGEMTPAPGAGLRNVDPTIFQMDGARQRGASGGRDVRI